MVAWQDVAKWATKYWAYSAASFLCLVVVALMAGACGAQWYQQKGTGQIYNMATSRRGNFFSFDIRYYMFHLEYDQWILTTGGGFFKQPTVTCDYTDSNCVAIRDPYDTTQFQGMYAAIFTFALATIVTAIVLGFLLLFMNWRAEAMPGMGAKILTVIAIVLAVMLLAFVLITWALIWRHPKSTREAVGLNDNFCSQWDISDRYKGGVYCLWQDDWSWSDTSIRNLTFFTDVQATGVSQTHGPTAGWILTTISFGFSSWIVLLTLGWRPAFFKS
jgi:hypothetical protein